MSQEFPVVLIVDDEPLIRETLADFMEDSGYEVLTAESGEDGLDILKRGHVDYATVDMRLPGMDGNAFIIQALKINPELRLCIFTGSTDYVLPAELSELGLGDDHVLTKPLMSLDVLLERFEKLYGAKA